jgi:hypothetical protein
MPMPKQAWRAVLGMIAAHVATVTMLVVLSISQSGYQATLDKLKSAPCMKQAMAQTAGDNDK